MALAVVTQTASMPARLEAITAANNALLMIMNGTFTAPITATATVTSQAKTTATLVYKVDGVFKSLAATDNFWTLTGGTVAISSWQKWLLLVSAAGVASVIAGTASAVSAAKVVLPNLPNGFAVAGVLTVATSGATTFIPGTTLLGAAGITATFIDGIDPLQIPLVAIV